MAVVELGPYNIISSFPFLLATDYQCTFGLQLEHCDKFLKDGCIVRRPNQVRKGTFSFMHKMLIEGHTCIDISAM